MYFRRSDREEPPVFALLFHSFSFSFSPTGSEVVHHCLHALRFSVLLSPETVAKELDTINSPQTLIATFVYLSFLSVLALHPFLHPSPLFSTSLSLSLSPSLFHWPAAFLSSTHVHDPAQLGPAHPLPAPRGPAGKPETPRAHPGLGKAQDRFTTQLKRTLF